LSGPRGEEEDFAGEPSVERKKRLCLREERAWKEKEKLDSITEQELEKGKQLQFKRGHERKSLPKRRGKKKKSERRDGV